MTPVSELLLKPVRALVDQVGGSPVTTAAPIIDQRGGIVAGLAAIGYSAPDSLPPRQILSTGADVYRFEPAQLSAGSGVVVYVHGGGFTTGGIASHAGTAQALADVSGHPVLFVDYRLAPEHPAPAAINDIVAAVDVHIGSDPHLPMILIGDSAGGALAFWAALRLRDAGVGMSALLLVNPMLDPRADSPSYAQYAEGYFAPAVDFRAGWAAFGGDDVAPDGADARLEGLPPTYIWTHEADPVRDEAESMARRLAAADVPVIALRSIGTVHASWLLAKALPQATMLLASIAGVARTILSKDEERAP
jgi:acetyl esterase